VKESRGWGFQPQQINLLRLEAPATFRSAHLHGGEQMIDLFLQLRCD
jgi:hypothetical protein